MLLWCIVVLIVCIVIYCYVTLTNQWFQSEIFIFVGKKTTYITINKY